MLVDDGSYSMMPFINILRQVGLLVNNGFEMIYINFGKIMDSGASQEKVAVI